MRRATLLLVAISFVLAALVIPSAAHAAPARGAAPAAQASTADAGAGGGFLTGILDWLVDFAMGYADSGDQPVAPAPEGASDEGDVLPTADPNG